MAISYLKSFRTIFLAALIIFATGGVIRSQEPIVVTTVKRPVETVKKDSVPPPTVVPSVTVKDTIPDTNQEPGGFMNSITLKSNSVISDDRTSIGFGLGQDFGGIGSNILFYPQKNFGAFLGLGYNLVGLGYNLGLKSKITLGTSSNNIALSALVMYGYNGVIIVENRRGLSRIFHGFTLGAGVDIKPWSFNSDYISLGLNIPLRGPEVQEYINYLKYTYNVEFKRELLPISISIGYRIAIN